MKNERAALMTLALALANCMFKPGLPEGVECEQGATLAKVRGDLQSAAPGAQLPLPLVVGLTNACGQPIPHNTISWSPERAPIQRSTTGADGLASFFVTLPGAPGTFRILATWHHTEIGGYQRDVVFEAEAVEGLPTQTCAGAQVQDRFDADAGWTRTTEATPGLSDSVRFEGTGGAGGGYRRMAHELPNRGDIVVDHWYDSFYSPRQEGPIRRIHYVEDRIQFSPPFTGAAVGSGFLVRQGGRRVALPLPVFRETTWQRAELVAGPADLAGIDLSSNGGPIQFGYYRGNTSSGGITVQHGIDNWTVEVCR
jgi:hypothetical protein